MVDSGGGELSSDEHGSVLSLIAEIADCADVEAFSECALRGLLELIPAVSASLNQGFADGADSRVTVHVEPKPARPHAENFRPILTEHWATNPLVKHFYDTGDTRVLMWSDLVAVDELRATVVHRQFYAKFGINHQLAVLLPVPGGRLIGVALNRTDRAFSERDRAILGTIRPHLVASFRAAELRGEHRLMSEALEANGWAIALVDPDSHHVVRSVGAIEALADEGIEIRLGGPLPDEVAARVAETAAIGPDEPLVASDPISLDGHSSDTLAQVVPGSTEGHLVLFGRPSRRRVRLLELGLTDRQVEVGLALLDGGTNDHIARRMGISAGTVRKHLERVFEVLEADNRATAAARIRRLG